MGEIPFLLSWQLTKYSTISTVFINRRHCVSLCFFDVLYTLPADTHAGFHSTESCYWAFEYLNGQTIWGCAVILVHIEYWYTSLSLYVYWWWWSEIPAVFHNKSDWCIRNMEFDTIVGKHEDEVRCHAVFIMGFILVWYYMIDSIPCMIKNVFFFSGNIAHCCSLSGKASFRN